MRSSWLKYGICSLVPTIPCEQNLMPKSIFSLEEEATLDDSAFSRPKANLRRRKTLMLPKNKHRVQDSIEEANPDKVGLQSSQVKTQNLKLSAKSI